MHRQLVPEHSGRHPAQPLRLPGFAFVLTLALVALCALAVWMSAR
jgi:hypothetical protein